MFSLGQKLNFKSLQLCLLFLIGFWSKVRPFSEIQIVMKDGKCKLNFTEQCWSKYFGQLLWPFSVQVWFVANITGPDICYDKLCTPVSSESLNDSRLQILGKQKILEQSQNWIKRQLDTSHPSKNYRTANIRVFCSCHFF